MELGWIFFGIVFICIFVFNFFLTKYFEDSNDSSKLTTVATTSALSFSLLCLLIIPIDVFVVSNKVDAKTGLHLDPVELTDNSEGVKYLLYGMYIILLTFAFLILPFVYFWFEEEGEEGEITCAQQSWAAFKYTIGFLIIITILIIVGAVIKSGEITKEQDQWEKRILKSFNSADAVLGFCIGCLAVLGLPFYCIYTAYGLASMPINMMRNYIRPKQLSKDDDIEIQIERLDEDLQFIESKYEMIKKHMSKKDKKRHDRLTKEKKTLERKRQRILDATNPDTCGQKCWNCLYPFRIMLGLVFLLLSIALFVSLLLSSIDKIMNSKCGSSCGFAIEKPTLINPINEILYYSAQAFPMDYFTFGGIVAYIFLSSVYGLTKLGIRILCMKLYDVKKRKTMPHALVMGAFFLMFVVLVLNIQVLTLAPQYATFGTQFFIDPKKPAEKIMCSMANVTNTQCVMTQTSQIIHNISLNFKLFGVTWYWGNWAFLAFFLIFFIHCLVAKAKVEAKYQRLPSKV